MSAEIKRCPKCGQLPSFVIEESFVEGVQEWTAVHLCRRGFSVEEGPCISKSDAIDAWNLHVDGEVQTNG